MNIITNIESGKIYNVKSFTLDENPLSPFFGKKLMNVERLFDGYVPQGHITTESRKYRLLTPEEIIKLLEILPRFARSGVPISMAHLTQPLPPENEQTRDQALPNPQPSQSMNTEQMQQMAAAMPEVGVLIEPTDRNTFDRLIVHDKVKKELDMGINLILNKDQLDNDWGLSEISPMKNRCIMNFVGPPGTGKTESAKAIAKKVGKNLYKVDYSQVISKWVGETGKHISSAFASAKEKNAILFFDEADSLMSKRISMADDGGQANSINQNRNIMMQELDVFDGIVLMASNFFENYDEALLRRIAQHVHFELPDEGMREKIIDIHIPIKTKERFENVDIKALARESKNLSGGDILVFCENAIKRASLEGNGRINQECFIAAIESIKKNKQVHKTWKKPRAVMGFGAHFNKEGETA